MNSTMNSTMNNQLTFNCRFCHNPMDSSEVSSNTINTVLECQHCTHLYNIILLYKYKFINPLEPTLYNISIFLTNNLLLTYRPLSDNLVLEERHVSQVRIKPVPNPLSNLYHWEQIAELPISLLDKPLPNIIEKINLLKPFI
jgi:hypothetical protein